MSVVYHVFKKNQLRLEDCLVCGQPESLRFLLKEKLSCFFIIPIHFQDFVLWFHTASTALQSEIRRSQGEMQCQQHCTQHLLLPKTN